MIDPSTYTASYYSSISDRTAGYRSDNKAKSANSAQASAPASPPAETAGQGGFLGFLKGLLDTINPLQHIPVVGAIYRHVTGDIPSDMARIAGDTLFGGPVGAVVGLADLSLKKSTGKDMGETVFAMISPSKQAPTQVAAKDNSEIIWNDASGVIKNTASGAIKNDAPKAPPDIVWDDEKTDPKPVARDQVAARMMEALDKYQALKKAENQPSVSALF
jgi:hypothetical protein